MGDEGVAEGAEEDEADAALVVFFVAAGDLDEGVGREAGVVGEGEGEFEGGEALLNAEGVFGGEGGVGDGEMGCGAEAEGDGFAVEVAAVAGGGFDGVAEGVAEVEEGAEAFGFVFVRFDDAGFDGDVAADEGGEVAATLGDGVDEGEHVGIANGGVFDDFGEAFVPLGFGEGIEGAGIGEDEGGLVEGTDHVFGGGEVDAGFAADGAVDLGKDGGGDLDVGDAALVDGGAEAAEVADDAAAEGDEEAFAVETGACHVAEDGFCGVEGFGGFAGGDGDEGGFDAGDAEAGEGVGGVEGGDVGVGDEGGAIFAGEEVGGAGAEFVEEAGADEDVVAAGVEIDADALGEGEVGGIRHGKRPG